MKRIAILYDCPYPFFIGGGQKRLYEVAIRLAKKGWRIDWYSLKFWEGDSQIEYKGINYYGIGKKKNLYNKKGKRLFSETIYYGYKVLSILNLRNYDIILCGQWPYLHIFPSKIFSKIGSAKLVIDWWEIWESQFIKHDIRSIIVKSLEKICSRLPDGIITISNKVKIKLINIGIRSDRIKFISDGIDFSKINNSPEYNSNNIEYDIIYVGRLQEYKNINHLIEAISILKKKYKLILKLLLIGDGPARPDLEKLSISLGVNEVVKFEGIISSDLEVFSNMKSAKIFVHPSTKEGGASISALEANACGLPVLAYQHPDGISEEYIIQGENGYWVNKIGPEYLAAELARIFREHSYKNMKMDCINFARKFDWDILSESYNDYFIALTEK